MGRENLEKFFMSKVKMLESALPQNTSGKKIEKEWKDESNSCRTRQREQKQKVLCEIRLLKKISHPQIVKFIEAFESFNEIIIVTEFLNGGELFDRYPLKNGIKSII